MANTDFDFDPLTGAQLPRPIPGIAHGAITGINGISGIWDGADVPGVGLFPGAAGTNKVLGGAAKKIGKSLNTLTYDPTSAPAPDNDQGRWVTNPNKAPTFPGDVYEPGSGPAADAPPVSDKTPLTSDVWTNGAQPINTYGGGPGMASARSDDNPGSSRDTTSGQTQTAYQSPNQHQGNSGFTRGSNSSGLPDDGGLLGILGRAFENIGNWRDQNRLTLLALAGGLAGSQSIGQGIGRAFQGAAAVQPQQFSQNNQNATMRFFMSPQGGGMSPDMARAFSASPQLTQEALGQITGLTPPKTITVQPGQRQLTWVPGKGWQNIAPGGSAGGGSDLYNDPAKWDAASVDERLAAVRAQYGDEYAASVKALGEGRYLPPNRQGQVWGTAQSVYGMLDQGAIKARQDAYKKFYGGGDVDKRLTAFNQAFAQHGADLPEAIEANNNYSLGGRLLNQPLSEAGRLVGTNTTTGPLATNTKALVDEVANLWKASGSTDKEIEGWHDAVYNDLVYGSPQQQRAAAAKLEQLGEGAINALEDQKQRDFGPAAASMPPLMSPATRQSLAKLKAWAAGGPASKPAQQAPQAINAGAVVEQAGHHYRHMPDGSFVQLD